MKTKFLACLLMSLLFVSCGEDRTYEYMEKTARGRWIDAKMREVYFWYADMKAEEELNYFGKAATFFKSLLSSSDKYSVIEAVEEEEATRSLFQPDDSYGFEFELLRLGTSSSACNARILYVVPGSPAADAGLERGDWINSVDHITLTSSNYENLLLRGASATFNVGAYDTEADTIRRVKDVVIPASRVVEYNPVAYSAVIPSDKGNIGYLVYNNFTSGRTDTDQAYDDRLRALSQEFKSQGVAEFILDLRYNTGGALGPALLLSAILAPETALGQPFGSTTYNDQWPVPGDNLVLDKDKLGSGTNLNLKRLYVLTTSKTASAAELLINYLAPYMEVHTIGERTTGGSYGSLPYPSEEYQLVMYPVVCQLSDAAGNTDYASATAVDYAIGTDTIPAYYPFGDEQDAFLKKAVGLIEGEEEVPDETETGTRAVSLTSVYSSLTRRAMPGVIME